jgi:TRAP-type transport system periplasmic protein
MKVKCLLILFTLILVISGSFVFTAGAGELEIEEVVTLEFSTNAAPGTPHGMGQIRFAEEVEHLSDGTLKIKNYAAGELYTQEAEVTAVRRGTLAITLQGPEWFTDFAPFMEMFATPFFFESPEHMYAVMNGEIGEEVYKKLIEQTGVRPLSTWLMGGTRELLVRDIGRKIETPDDMKGILLRMPNSPSWLRMGESLGADPTPVAITETYLALQTGTVDAVEGPLTAIAARKFYEAADTLYMTSHYLTPIMLVVNEKIWQSLSDDHQSVLMQAAALTQKYVDSIVTDLTQEAMEEIKAGGIHIVEIDQTVWREAALKFYDEKGFTKNFDWEMLDQIQALAD